MNNQELLRLYNNDFTSEMSGAGGKGNTGNGRDGKNYIKGIKGKVISMDTCDKGMIGLYFVLLLLVLIMAGNLISNTQKASAVSWVLFTLTLFLGLGGMFCIYKGGKYKKLGLTIISLASGVFLMTAMIMSGTSSSMRDKFSAHLANVLFVIVSIIAAVITS
jgi:hypothetical protein